MNFNKQKIFEIIVTALISAGIAFLQSLATSHLIQQNPVEVAGLAGGIGGLIRSFRHV